MAFRDDLLRRIEKKQEEIFSLESQLREAKSYLQALEDTVKMMPREGLNEGQADTLLRPGSTIARARDAIIAAGRPLHIQEILSAVGRPSTKEARAALSGSLASYVRRNEIFSRPAPNTFGLIELAGRANGTVIANGSALANGRTHEPPPGFGADDDR
jgi:hypothetical protein